MQHSKIIFWACCMLRNFLKFIILGSALLHMSCARTKFQSVFLLRKCVSLNCGNNLLALLLRAERFPRTFFGQYAPNLLSQNLVTLYCNSNQKNILGTGTPYRPPTPRHTRKWHQTGENGTLRLRPVEMGSKTESYVRPNAPTETNYLLNPPCPPVPQYHSKHFWHRATK